MRSEPPAKINLTLDIGPRRADGYHEVDTVYQAVDLRDEVRVEAEGKRHLSEEDLVIRALRRLDPNMSWSVGLRKNIPMRAGLGGGSADCAAGLLLGGKLLDVPMPRLLRHAACLGSDVAFFLVGGAARGQGRGERLTPLPDLPEMWFCIAKPGHGVSTPEAFELLSRTERSRGTSTERLVAQWDKVKGAVDLAPFLHNDFEPVIRRSFAEVDTLLDELRERGALAAVLCGSGSAVAGLCADSAHAEQLANLLEAQGYWARAVRTLRREEWP